jgi:hypothetical protein
MLVFRSLAIGLLGACMWLLATRPFVQLHVREQPPVLRAAPSAMSEPPTVVDVASGVTGAQLVSLVRLGPNEHVATIDDRPVDGDLEAGAHLASLDVRARRYLDLGVRGATGSRRVLVLFH